jgi:hypothetical protein
MTEAVEQGFADAIDKVILLLTLGVDGPSCVFLTATCAEASQERGAWRTEEESAK